LTYFGGRVAQVAHVSRETGLLPPIKAAGVNPVMGKRCALVGAYIEALGARALYVHGGPAGEVSQVRLDRNGCLDVFDVLWFSKPQHAELVLLQSLDDFAADGRSRGNGWLVSPPREVRDKIVNVAAMLGAIWQTEAELRTVASNVVEEIIVSVEKSRRDGGLAQVNASYKIYRQRQVARGEKAVPYSAHLAAFTRSLVVLAAQNARPNQPRSES
jgi:hypothetical protein